LFFNFSYHFKRSLFMSVRNKDLTVVKARERQRCLDQLRLEGLEVGEGSDAFESWEEPCALEIAESDHYAIISDLPPTDFAVVVPLKIIAHRTTTLADCSIELPWGECVHIASLRERRGSYHLGPFTYPVADVLNDYFETLSTLSRGRTLDGVILAYGCSPIPDDIRSGFVPVRVTVTDDSSGEASIDVRLAVRRVPMNVMTASASAKIDAAVEVACAREADVPLQVSNDLKAGEGSDS
jgi:hypothetical protein